MLAGQTFSIEILWQIEDFEVPCLSEYKMEITRNIREKLPDAQVSFDGDNIFGSRLGVSLPVEASSMGMAIDKANKKVGAVVQGVFPGKEVEAVKFTAECIAA